MSVEAITVECLAIITSFLVWPDILTISRSLDKGQGHRGKNEFLGLLDTVKE